MGRGPLERTSKWPRRSEIEHIAVNAIAPKGEPNRGVERQGKRAIFPRSARLLRRADFERVYKQGRRHFSVSMTVFYLPRLEEEKGSGLRVGFTVGRALGGAVQRNRMKRRLREAVRLCRPVAAGDADVVINPKKSVLTTDFAALRNEVSRAFDVIQQELAETASKTRSGSRKV